MGEIMLDHAVKIEESAPYELFVPSRTSSSGCSSKWRRCALAALCSLPLLTAGFLARRFWVARQQFLEEWSWEMLKRDEEEEGQGPTPIHDRAYIVIIRHGEKPDKGDHLSDIGERRAKYLARCMSQRAPTTALPIGRPSYVMASHGMSEHSQRPIETVLPLAKALGLQLDSDLYFKETKGFAQHIQDVLKPGMTLVAAWHHGEIGLLVKELLGQEKWRLGDLAWPSEWPKRCGSGLYTEPKFKRGGECYDLVWRITMIRKPRNVTWADLHGEGKNETKIIPEEKLIRFGWKAASLTASLQGFRGNEDDPCREGLTPIDPLLNVLAEPGP